MFSAPQPRASLYTTTDAYIKGDAATLLGLGYDGDGVSRFERALEAAFATLARALDVMVMTRRRYRRRELVDLCHAARLDVLFVSYFTSFGFPLIVAIKTFQRLRRSSTGQKSRRC